MSSQRHLGSLLLVVLCATAMTTSCAVGKVRGVDEQVYKRRGYALKEPAGWNRVLIRSPNYMLFAQGGQERQRIRIGRLPHVHAFPTTRVVPDSDLLPQQLAEHFLTEFRARHDQYELSDVRIEAADVGAVPGVRLDFVYLIPSEIYNGDRVYRERRYLAAAPYHLYSLEYRVLADGSVDSNMDAFERMRRSFRIIDKKPPKTEHFIR